MKSANRSLFYIVILLALLTVGCSRAAPSPTPTATAVPTATPAVSPTSIATVTPTAASERVIYIVQPGDTLSSIAEKFGTTLEAIIEANNIADPDLVRAGEELIIPRE